MPGKPTAPASLVPSAISRSLANVLSAVSRPVRIPRWAVVCAVAALVLGGYLAGRRHPAHHYVAYFGYPMVLDTTTGKACYAVPPRPADPAGLQDTAFPVDGTANQLGTQAVSGPQIPLCGDE
jgi:hypothetical protein